MLNSIWLWYKDSHGTEVMQPCSSLQDAITRQNRLRNINDIIGRALILQCIEVISA